MGVHFVEWEVKCWWLIHNRSISFLLVSLWKGRFVYFVSWQILVASLQRSRCVGIYVLSKDMRWGATLFACNHGPRCNHHGATIIEKENCFFLYGATDGEIWFVIFFPSLTILVFTFHPSVEDCQGPTDAFQQTIALVRFVGPRRE